MINEQLNEQQIHRLWEYRNLIDVEFYTRLNFFLIFESLLLSVVSILYATHISRAPLWAFVFLGLFITGIWLYIQAGHKAMYEHVRNLCRKNIPEYELFRHSSWPHSRWPVSTMSLLAYAIPVLVAGLWVIFLFL